jgi:disulfide bond formation protein DsbB
MPVSDRAALAALLGSAGLLTAALLFEHLGGIAPCPLCQWQRAGHLLALLGALSLFGPSPVRRLPGLFGASGSAAVGTLQLGMERGWWSGPSGCGGAQDLAGLSAAETLERMLLTVPVPCDAVTWSLMSLSMAGWNALLSALIAGLWSLSAIRKNMRIRHSDERLAPRT